MTIGIDLRVLASGKTSGIEQYTLSLLSHMIPLDKSIKYKLFYNGFKKKKIDLSLLDNYNVSLYSKNIPNRLLFASSKILDYPKIDLLLEGVDVFFSPHIFIAPVSEKCPKIITVHDLGFEYFPEFLPKSGLFLHKYIFNPNQQLNQAQKIIAVSKSTKDDLVRIYKIPEEKIEVIYSAVDQFEFDDSRIPEVKQKYNLPDEYILYLGTIEPRKNILGIVKTFEILKKEQLETLKLVIAGESGWLNKPIYQYIKSSKFRNDIIMLGFIPKQDKPYIYKLAKCFVYPSFFEGFGFQVLEAASLGVPIITSNTSSLPEIIGSVSLMADPYNPKEISGAIKTVLTSETLAKSLSELGKIKAQKFTWDNCARRTLQTITSLV